MENISGFIIIIVVVALIIYFNNKKKEDKVKEEEEAKIKELEREEKEKEELETLKLKWEEKKEEIKINGLPIVEEHTLKLTKNEQCHFVGTAHFCKVKKQVSGYEGGSRGVSLRLMKGVSFRVGNHKGHYISSESIEKTTGTIYLTNKKIVFSGIANSFVLKFDKIVNLNNIDNMLQIQTEEKTYLFQIDNLFDFLIVLDFILNKNEE